MKEALRDRRMSEFQLNSFKWTKFSFDRHNFSNYYPNVVQNCEHEVTVKERRKKNKRLPYGR